MRQLHCSLPCLMYAAAKAGLFSREFMTVLCSLWHIKMHCSLPELMTCHQHCASQYRHIR